MKDILIEGHRILTTDEIADAVLAYAQVLVENHTTDIVEFPALHDGDLSRCALLLGGPATLATFAVPVAMSAAVMGSATACAEIVRRMDALR